MVSGPSRGLGSFLQHYVTEVLVNKVKFPAPREAWGVSFELIQIVPFKANGFPAPREASVVSYRKFSVSMVNAPKFPAPPKAWGVSYATEVGD